MRPFCFSGDVIANSRNSRVLGNHHPAQWHVQGLRVRSFRSQTCVSIVQASG